MNKLDVCTVGEINLDLILYGLPEQIERERELLATGLSITLGSSSAIFAHNLSALGSSVGFVSLVGPDQLGQIALDRLKEGGVDISRVRRCSEGNITGLTVILAHPGHRYILTYPGTTLEMCFADLDLDYIYSARHLHLSSYFLLRALRPAVPQLFRRAKEAGLTTSLETNDDPENEWGGNLREALKYVDVFLQNEREACRETGTQDLGIAIKTLSQSVPLLVVKRGPKGAVALRGSEQWEGSPPPLEKVVDTVGAGDSFDAGFIHQFIRGAGVEKCLAFANLAGAYSTTQAGGTEAFRDLAEMQAFFCQHAPLLRTECRAHNPAP